MTNLIERTQSDVTKYLVLFNPDIFSLLEARAMKLLTFTINHLSKNLTITFLLLI